MPVHDHEDVEPQRTPARGAGAALVEAAIVLPIVLLFIMGLFEYGRYFLMVHVCDNAVSAGAAYACKHTSPIVISGTTYGNAASDVTNIVNSNLGTQQLARPHRQRLLVGCLRQCRGRQRGQQPRTVHQCGRRAVRLRPTDRDLYLRADHVSWGCRRRNTKHSPPCAAARRTDHATANRSNSSRHSIPSAAVCPRSAEKSGRAAPPRHGARALRRGADPDRRHDGLCHRRGHADRGPDPVARRGRRGGAGRLPGPERQHGDQQQLLRGRSGRANRDHRQRHPGQFAARLRNSP